MWCCRFMFVCMYICMYVYPSHSTRDILIAQLLTAIALFPAVCRRHARQVGPTLHHHWPQTCSLCRLITVHCVQLSLLFNHADTSTIWMWSSCTPHGPDPCPCPLGKCTTSVQYMCTIMWVSIGQHVHSCPRLLTPSKLSHMSFLHPAMSLTLAKLTQSRTSTTW